MKIKNTSLSILSASVLLLGVAAPAFAETTANLQVGVGGGSDSKPVQGTRQDIKTAARVQVKTDRANLKTEVKTNRVDAREEMKDNKASTTQIRQEMKVENKEAREAFRADVAKTRATAATSIVSATIERLNTIVGRVESRIAKVQAGGGNTTEAQASVDLAKTNLLDARAQVTAINAIDLSTSMSSTTAQTNFQIIRTDAAKARTDLESAKQNLIKAVTSLEKIEKSIKVTASTTATVNQ